MGRLKFEDIYQKEPRTQVRYFDRFRWMWHISGWFVLFHILGTTLQGVEVPSLEHDFVHRMIPSVGGALKMMGGVTILGILLAARKFSKLWMLDHYCSIQSASDWFCLEESLMLYPFPMIILLESLSTISSFLQWTIVYCHIVVIIEQVARTFNKSHFLLTIEHCLSLAFSLSHRSYTLRPSCSNEISIIIVDVILSRLSFPWVESDLGILRTMVIILKHAS